MRHALPVPSPLLLPASLLPEQDTSAFNETSGSGSFNPLLPASQLPEQDTCDIKPSCPSTTITTLSASFSPADACLSIA
jgi:hypothetical protein